MACAELRDLIKPVSSFHHDWMHGVRQGTMPIYMFLILEAMSWQNFTEYTKLWFLPASQNCKLSDLFTPKRIEAHKKSKRLKISASEVLSLFPVLEHYVLKVASKTAACAAQSQAFLATCRFLCMLRAADHMTIRGSDFDKVAENVLQLGKACGWDSFFVKKFHWLFHYGDTLELHGVLLNCFSVERKHKQVLRVGQDVANLSRYEASMYKEVLGQQLARLRTAPSLPFSLQKDCAPTKKMVQALQACGYTCSACCSTLQAPCSLVKKGDAVLLVSGDKPFDCGEVWSHFLSGNDMYYTVPNLFDFRNICTETCRAFCNIADKPQVVPSCRIRTSVIFARAHAGVTTLIPWHLQQRLWLEKGCKRLFLTTRAAATQASQPLPFCKLPSHFHFASFPANSVLQAFHSYSHLASFSYSYSHFASSP